MKIRFVLLFYLLLLPLALMAQNVGGEIRRPQQQQSQSVRKPSQPVKTQQQLSTNITEASTTPAKNRDAIIQNLINNMVQVEGGTFTMGATPEQGSDASDREEPGHQVTLSSYKIGKYEVTQEEWVTVMGNNPSAFKGDKKPVEKISWDDCQKFIQKLNNITGLNFRLPTEAEWEFAARGGKRSKGNKYSGSNTLENVAWYSENSDSNTHDVGKMSPNELGLFDMSGNVCEWCQDWYDYYGYRAQTNPQGPISGNTRVIRGGVWYSSPEFCRVSSRKGYSQDKIGNDVGFRLAM